MGDIGTTHDKVSIDIKHNEVDTGAEHDKNIGATSSTPEINSPGANRPTANETPLEQLEIEGDTDEEDTRVWPSGHKLWLTMASVLTAEVLSGLDLTIVAVAVPSLTDQFHAVSDIGWYTATYGIVASSLNFLFGKIYTVYSIKKIYIISLIIFEAGSLLCTVAPTSAAFIAGRAIAGIGKSGIYAGMNMCIVQSFPNHKRPLWLGIANGVFTLAMVSAPLIGGVLIDAWSWRLCFGINLPLGFIVVALTWYGFQTNVENPLTKLSFREKWKRLDFLGTIVLFPAITLFLISLQWGGSKYDWGAAIIVVLLVVSVVLMGVFAWIQHKQQDNAILPPRIAKNRTILAAAWFNVCINGALAITEQYLSIYFQGVKGYSATKAGILGIPLIIGLAAGAPLSGAAVSRVGYYAPFMLATSVLAPIAAGLLTTLDIDENNVKVLACLGLLGFACGLGLTVPSMAVQTVLKSIDVAIGIAIIGFGGGMGSAVFTCASAALFQNRLVQEVRESDPSVDANWLRTVGLSDIRRYIRPDQLRAVLLGYDEAVVQTLYMPLALSILTIIGSVTIEWRSVKKKVA